MRVNDTSNCICLCRTRSALAHRQPCRLEANPMKTKQSSKRRTVSDSDRRVSFRNSDHARYWLLSEKSLRTRTPRVNTLRSHVRH